MRVQKTLRIAHWEVKRQVGRIDRTTVLFAIAAIVILGLAISFGGIGTVDEGIHTVGTTEESPYTTAFEEHSELRVVEYESEADVEAAATSGAVNIGVLNDGEAVVHDSDHGNAALAEVQNAVDVHNEQQFRTEKDYSAAFPVQVSLVYIEPAETSLEQHAYGEDMGETTDESESSTTDESTFLSQAPDNNVAGESPADIQPPFPFESLILAFAFLLPMYFVVQLYASSILDERLNHRGELLLVSPVSSMDIIAGKTLPYALGLATITAGIATVFGAGVLSVLALTPFIIAYLGAGFLAGLFARSYSDLTSVVLAVAMFFTMFAFVPAMFTSVSEIAAISPLYIVVQQLEGAAIELSMFLFSTVPLLITGLLMFGFGTGIYREEDLFTQKDVRDKLVDALAKPVTSWKSPFLLSILVLPFVFAAQLLTLAALFVLPTTIAILGLVVVLAVIEEVAKSASIYAGFARNRFPSTAKIAVLAGAVSGFGFFLAEKTFVVAQMAGLSNMPLAEIAFGGAVISGGTGSLGAVVILFFFPILHSLTTIVSSLGARHGKLPYIIGLVLATLIHVSYNLMVVMVNG